MREILFRGKRNNNGEWIFGNLEYNPITKLTFISIPKDIHVDVEMVNNDTVCQYTGLKDKNEKKIFEGDILKPPRWLMKAWENDLCVCKWVSDDDVYDIQGFGLFIGDRLLRTDEWDEFEIIGNIFDNPELLNTEDI